MRTFAMWRALRMNKQVQTMIGGTAPWRGRRIVRDRWSTLPLVPALSFLHRYDILVRRISAKPAQSGDLQSALSRTATVHDVLDVWEAHKDTVFTHNVVRSCLHYSLKAAKTQQLTFPEMFELSRFDLFWNHLIDEVPSMSANSAIKCLYNCAQFNFQHKPLALSLMDVCTQKSKSIPSVSVGILLWSLKRLELISSSSARPLVAHVIDLFHTKLCTGERFKPQTLSNILWVLASTDNLPVHISERVIDCLPQYTHKFDFHSLSLSLWSLTASGATLPQQSLDAAACAAAGFLEIREKSVPNIVHCCWAFASAEHYHEQFCKTLSRSILSESSNSSLFTPRLLSSVAWMCARVSYHDPVLLDHIASLALDKVRRFNAQDLGNLMYAYAQLNHPHRQLVSVVTARFVSEHELLGDNDACMSIAWANLAIGEYPLSLLEHMMTPHRVARLIEVQDQNGLNFLLRLEVLLRTERPDLAVSLANKTAVFASTLVHVRWCHPHSKLLHSVVSALLKITGSNSYFTVEALTTALYSIDIEVMLDTNNDLIPIPQHWQSWESLQCLLQSPLLAENDPELHRLLQDGNSTTENFDASKQPLSLASDWAGLVGGPSCTVANRVAIEVDGPWHYAANCVHTLGKTVLKHRVLKGLGWRVISIPYFEWQQLKSEAAQVDYLRTSIFRTEH